ncbi:Uma2 family endonuclease [Nocardia anaemiae]|uniref:Uma2 family endonuclease n=1 Tax=Nocardia anaemiae TaxID=263910 RepID=UPI0007A47E73|nr:Uma2 family endonuclease [Nocardia anaemiae]
MTERRGPYTHADLRRLPDGGKGFELEDGWLIAIAGGARHDFVVQRLGRLIDIAAGVAAVHVFVGGGWEVNTPSGIRKPDIVVIPRDVARAAIIAETPRLIPGTQVLLAVEVIAPGDGSERTDRVRKVHEYAAIEIPQYWIVEHHPEVRIHRMLLADGAFRARPVVTAGTVFTAAITADPPFRVSFDPAALIEI